MLEVYERAYRLYVVTYKIRYAKCFSAETSCYRLVLYSTRSRQYRKWSPTANDPETSNDPETANDPQKGPQMILDRKWSLKSTANDAVKTWRMEWILWDWLQKWTDYKKGTFFSRLLKKKGKRTLHLRSIYTRWKKKNGINLKRIWYSPYTSFFVRIQFYVINSKTFVRNLGARYVTRHDLT